MTALLAPLALSTGTARAAIPSVPPPVVPPKLAAAATAAIDRSQRVMTALSWAKKEEGKPYVWAATGPNSFDCSGLTQFIYAKAGIRLPRTAHEQYHYVQHKVSWKDLQPGDLVFFHNLHHVGIVSRVSGGEKWMINAPHTGAFVRENLLDAQRKATFYGAVRPY
jgi:cell wall-associated NlpC family hydrolase